MASANRTNSNKKASRKRETRPERTPMGGTRQKLSVANQDPNYVYRWVKDVKDGARINQALEAGYEFVQREEVGDVGEGDVNTGNRDLNSYVSQHGGVENDKSFRLYLMRIKKKWYDEDQKAKQVELDEVDDQLQRGTRFGVENQYGGVKFTK